jgi:hypothetical protein
MDKEWFSLFSAVIASGQKKISNYYLENPAGVTDADIQNAEIKLGFELPTELKSLLMEFDGIHEYTITDDGERIQVGSVIWNLLSIVEHHLSLTIPIKSKLFCFGGSVSGNSFGYLIVNDKPDENQIWQSDHETEFPDEQIVWRASSLREFITTALTKSRWY